MSIHERRREYRNTIETPIKINVGTQLSVLGQTKDISINSALILIKNNIFLDTNDKITFSFEYSTKGEKLTVEGSAYVSRIIKGEGFAISFTQLTGNSLSNLKKILNID